MVENWKDVPEYDGVYQVSNLGRVKSMKFSKEIILKPGKNTNGYYFVVLRNSKIKKTISIHQLVAMAFLNHEPNGYRLVVNHIDFNKQNNHISNLEIITNRENTNRKHLKSSSMYTGVTWRKDINQWRARIYINGEHKNLGNFKDEYEAHMAYQKELSKNTRQNLCPLDKMKNQLCPLLIE